MTLLGQVVSDEPLLLAPFSSIDLGLKIDASFRMDMFRLPPAIRCGVKVTFDASRRRALDLTRISKVSCSEEILVHPVETSCSGADHRGV